MSVSIFICDLDILFVSHPLGIACPKKVEV